MSQNNGWISAPCAFCHGEGVDPCNVLSSQSHCEVCKGRKTVLSAEAHARCPFCKGTGSYKTYFCLICRGKGKVAKAVAPTEICPQCEGSAVDSSCGMPCVDCRGLGRVLASKIKAEVHS
jgi:DnaJ-class molecular chaperone